MNNLQELYRNLRDRGIVFDSSNNLISLENSSQEYMNKYDVLTLLLKLEGIDHKQSYKKIIDSLNWLLEDNSK